MAKELFELRLQLEDPEGAVFEKAEVGGADPTGMTTSQVSV